MSEKVKAIVIKANDRKEKDKNILLFSLEDGKFWATLKGVKSPTAKMKLAQNPFCFGEFVLADGKMGKVVTGFEVLESFHEISEDINKYFEGTAVLEIVNALNFSSEQENASVFVLVLKTLKAICFGKLKDIYAIDKFLIELFKIQGFPLYTEKCSCCGTKSFERMFIDFSTGEIECMACKGFASQEIPKVVYMALKILNNTDFEKLDTVKLAEDSELALLKILVKNFECHFDKNLKLIGILS